MSQIRVIKILKNDFASDKEKGVGESIYWEGNNFWELSKKYPPSRIFGADPLGFSSIEDGCITWRYRFEKLENGVWVEIKDPRKRSDLDILTEHEAAIDEENRRLFPGDLQEDDDSDIDGLDFQDQPLFDDENELDEDPYGLEFCRCNELTGNLDLDCHIHRYLVERIIDEQIQRLASGQEPKYRQARKCLVCHELKHAQDCPQARLNKLYVKQSRMNCPACDAMGTVGLNSADYFECRFCHMQFVMGDDHIHEIVVLDYPNGEWIEAYVLDALGQGDFPLDRQIAEVQEELRLLLQKKAT